METIEQLPDTARGLWNVLKRTRAWELVELGDWN